MRQRKNLAWIAGLRTGPVPMNCFLQRPADNQDDKDQHDTKQDDAPISDGASRAQTGSYPNAGSRR